jgi:hydrogenase maturation protease
MSPSLRAWLSALLGAALGLALFVGAVQGIRSAVAAHTPGGQPEPVFVVMNLLLGPVAVVFGGALGWRLGSDAGPRGEKPVMHAPAKSILVIGYGNTLRRDDGAGYLAAEAVATWGRPGVAVRAIHQLVPELAEALADVDRVVFIDARPAREGDAAEVRPVEPRPPDAASRSALGHFGDPSLLLALASELYGRCPMGWVVTIPAVDFDLGEGLSPTARRGVADALLAITRLLDAPPAPDRAGDG